MERYFILSVNDVQQEPIELADGGVPENIDPAAKGYCLRLGEGAGLNTLSYPLPGAASTHSSAAASSSESANGAAAGDSDTGPTGWIQLGPQTAAIYFFSPDGEDEGAAGEHREPALYQDAEQTDVSYSGSANEARNPIAPEG
jgi:hypothetical protein